MAWVLALLWLSRLAQSWVPWGIGGCHLDPIWDEMDSAHEPFDCNCYVLETPNFIFHLLTNTFPSHDLIT